jgi:hypothetical protein
MKKEIKIQEKTPEFMTFYVYGSFEVSNTDGSNFFVCRVPNKINWHKKVLPAVKKLVRKIIHNKSKKLPDFYFEGVDSTDDNWKTSKSRNFEYVKDKFVERKK